MNELLHSTIEDAKSKGISFRGWTFYEVAAAIKLHTKTEHSVKDIADELVAMQANGEIDFV
ncbi:hypothetical protein ZHAWSFBX_CDS_0045 [Agrobacterium phage Alfirin]|nr:hypothetical protein ZHAWSFBX_CDS_0045 [Agrobacterium phage Alfirin]